MIKILKLYFPSIYLFIFNLKGNWVDLIFFNFYFIFKLYKIVLVMPTIIMNPPQVYMCSPSWTLLPLMWMKCNQISIEFSFFESPVNMLCFIIWLLAYEIYFWRIHFHSADSTSVLNTIVTITTIITSIYHHHHLPLIPLQIQLCNDLVIEPTVPSIGYISSASKTKESASHYLGVEFF